MDLDFGHGNSVDRIVPVTKFALVSGGADEATVGEKVLEVFRNISERRPGAQTGRMRFIPEYNAVLAFYEDDGLHAGQRNGDVSHRAISIPWDSGSFSLESLESLFRLYPSARVADLTHYYPSNAVHLILELPKKDLAGFDTVWGGVEDSVLQAVDPSVWLGEDKVGVKEISWERDGLLNPEGINNFVRAAADCDPTFRPIKFLTPEGMNFVYLFYQRGEVANEKRWLHVAPVKLEDPVITDRNLKSFFQTYPGLQLLDVVKVPQRSYIYLFFNLNEAESTEFGLRRRIAPGSDGVFDNMWHPDTSESTWGRRIFPGHGCVPFEIGMDSSRALIRFTQENPHVSAVNSAVPSKGNYIVLTTTPSVTDLLEGESFSPFARGGV